MDIIPAIDLKNGKCVRLRQGRDEETTVYSDNPIEVAAEWKRQGARRIHVVNLDGAFGRTSENLGILRDIVSNTSAHVQYGGGLRSLDSMQAALDAGAWKIVLGTVAIDDPALLAAALECIGAERIIVAVDAVKGKIATQGWRVVSETSLIDFVRRLHDSGVEEILSTDVERDGMMTGPDLSTLSELASSGLRVIASGGVSTVSDIRAILALKKPEISGVIVGKALYEGEVTLRELIDVSKDRFTSP
jgi:phosphoribosylformimino-5-aminoimidazole carboxamide ribotide isomerase